MNKNIFIINGGHCSGKTFLLKNLIKKYYNEIEEIKTEFGKYCKYKNTIILGKKDGKTIGESIQYKNIFNLLIYILEKEKNINNIIIEHILLSDKKFTFLKLFLYLKQKYKLNIINILLNISFKEIIKRLNIRTIKKQINKEFIYKKLIQINKVFLFRFLYNQINNFIIFVEKEDVINSFINIFNKYNQEMK